MEEKKVDRVVNEARTKAIEKAYIPRDIKESYNVSVKSGKVVLSKKK
jgi:hypothetical protein